MILVGDCLQVMPTLEADSFDSIVTDPPYGLGFMGKAWDHGVPGAEFWREALRVAKPGAWLAAFGGTRTYHRLACAIEDAGWELRDSVLRMHEGGAYVQVEDCPWLLAWAYGSGFPKSHNGPWGGTALKPAFEPIVLARKPLEGTVEANWRKYGTGALNIDGCRVPMTDADAYAINAKHAGMDAEAYQRPAGNSLNLSANPMALKPAAAHDAGRWPANLVHDGSEEVEASFAAFGERAAGNHPGRRNRGFWADKPPQELEQRRTEAGSAARFFYCAKASRADRNDGCEGMPLGMPLAPNGAENAVGSKRGSNSKMRANIHPTVKPTDLMRWLCRLVTPPGGVVLDPFAGSGSTGRGAVLEGLRFTGIELSQEYAAIARARIDAARRRREEEIERQRLDAIQPALFQEEP